MKPLANESWLATGILLTHVLYGGPFPTFKIAGLECSLPFYWERQNASEKEHASGTSRPWNAELFWASRWRLSILVNETATARLRVYKKPLPTSGGFGVCQRGPRWPAWVITRGLAPVAPRWQIPLPTSTVESGFLSECQFNPKYISFFFKKKSTWWETSTVFGLELSSNAQNNLAWDTLADHHYHHKLREEVSRSRLRFLSWPPWRGNGE